MLFGGTIRFEGENGISYVVKKKSGLIQVQVEIKSGGELLLEFAPKIAEALRVALNEIRAGSNSVAVDKERAEGRVRPDIYLHYDDEEVVAGFDSRDDVNPIEEDWPQLVIQGEPFRLTLRMNPDQAKILMGHCQRVVGLGAAVQAFNEGVIKIEGQAEEADA